MLVRTGSSTRTWRQQTSSRHSCSTPRTSSPLTPPLTPPRAPHPLALCPVPHLGPPLRAHTTRASTNAMPCRAQTSPPYTTVCAAYLATTRPVSMHLAYALRGHTPCTLHMRYVGTHHRHCTCATWAHTIVIAEHYGGTCSRYPPTGMRGMGTRPFVTTSGFSFLLFFATVLFIQQGSTAPHTWRRFLPTLY